MSPPQSYPSPPSQQAASGSGAPYYGPGVNDSTPIAPDLKQLQQSEESRPEVALRESLLASNDDGNPMYSHSAQFTEDHHRTTSPERLAQGVLNVSTEDEYHEGQPTRKRSKVSRACDECRRKKIRCDATFENVDQACSSCHRTGAICTFSRTPMKRGPSKGYIRELADRLQHLENQVGPSAPPPSRFPNEMEYGDGYNEEGTPLRYGDGHHPYMSSRPQETRKRTRSVSEGRNSARDPALTRSTGSWSADVQRSQVLAQQSQSRPYPPYGDVSHGAGMHQQEFSPTAGRQRGRESFGAQYESEADLELGRQVDLDETLLDEYDYSWLNRLREKDADSTSRYYRIIHPTFPFLPHSRSKLRTRLGRCPQTLCSAFLIALETMIRNSRATSLSDISDSGSSIRKASELISAFQFETSSDNKNSHTLISNNLVYMQTLILLALESDNHGPASMRGHGGPPQAELLGRAIGMANHMKINQYQSRDPIGEGDLDSNERLGRRIWWTLFILDRWHASSTSNILQLPDRGAILLPDDQASLGDPTFQLARISHILGHLSLILQQSQSLMTPDSPTSSIITLTLTGELDRFRESLDPALLTEPTLLTLSYLHVRLLVLRLTSATLPHELLDPARRMAQTLSIRHATPLIITPLHHHLSALAALTLADLCAFDETRRDAEQPLDELLEVLAARQSRDDNIAATTWDAAIRDAVFKKRAAFPAPANGHDRPGTGTGTGAAAVGLQHLADAASISGGGGPQQGSATAAGAPSSKAETSQFDPAALTRFGYLSALVRE